MGIELGGEDAHRDAGGTIDAAWAIGNRLAAAEADPPQSLVQFAGVPAVEFGEHLPLDLARQIGARTGVRDKKLREAKGCAHPRPHSNGYRSLYAAGKRRRKEFGRVYFRRTVRRVSRIGG